MQLKIFAPSSESQNETVSHNAHRYSRLLILTISFFAGTCSFFQSNFSVEGENPLKYAVTKVRTIIKVYDIIIKL